MNQSELPEGFINNATQPKKISILSSGGLSNQILERLEKEYSELFTNSSFESYYELFDFSASNTDDNLTTRSVKKTKIAANQLWRKQTDLHSFLSELEMNTPGAPVIETTSKTSTKGIDIKEPKPPRPKKSMTFKERAYQIFTELKRKLGLIKDYKPEPAVNSERANTSPGYPITINNVKLSEHSPQAGVDNNDGRMVGDNDSLIDQEEEIKYKLRQYIFDQIQDKDIVFIITYLDDISDLNNTFEIVELAKKFEIFTIVIACLPRFFGKVESVRLTNKTLQKLRLSAEMVLLLPYFDTITFKLIPDLIKELMEIIVEPGLINVDIADLKIIVKGGNIGVITFGSGRSSDRVRETLDNALSSKLLNVELGGVKKVLVNITGGPDMTLSEVDELAEQVKNRIQPGARLILGARIVPELENKLKLFIMLGVTPMQVMVNRYAYE